MWCLGAKPKGLSFGNNILILFQKTCEYYVFILSSFGMTCDFQRVEGTHADGSMQLQG